MSTYEGRKASTCPKFLTKRYRHDKLCLLSDHDAHLGVFLWSFNEINILG